MATPGGAQGTLEYQVETYSCFICDEAKYYYTFLNDGTAVTRTIDLAPMVQEGIYEHDKIHEYRTREIVGDKEEVIVYNVFYVDTIDTEYHWDVLDYEYASVGGTIDDGYKRWWGGVGKQVPYYIHTRLNLTTGQMSSRTTKCTVVAGLPKDGLFYVNDLDDPAGDFTLGWHHMTQETRDLMSPLFPFGAFVVYAISNSYVGFNFRHLTAQTPLVPTRDLADPSPIFSNAYSGDWISQINFDSTGFLATSISYLTNMNDVMDFLELFIL